MSVHEGSSTRDNFEHSKGLERPATPEGSGNSRPDLSANTTMTQKACVFSVLFWHMPAHSQRGCAVSRLLSVAGVHTRVNYVRWFENSPSCGVIDERLQPARCGAK
eukprot:4742851-Alexandrium_andersonii.AAC.1